jgi:hypothetical protein
MSRCASDRQDHSGTRVKAWTIAEGSYDHALSSVSVSGVATKLRPTTTRTSIAGIVRYEQGINPGLVLQPTRGTYESRVSRLSLPIFRGVWI